MKTTTTINDVASAAGVSIGTVSRVINNRPGVSSAAMQVVRRAMNELGYEPPPLQNRRGPKPGKRNHVRQPRSSKQVALFTLGIPRVQLQSPIYSELLNGVHDGLRAAGKSLTVNILEAPTLDMVQEGMQQVDGAIFFCSSAARQLIEPHRGSACVQVFGAVQAGEWWDHVTYRNAVIGPLAVQWLRSRGHEHLAMLGSNGPDVHFRERHQSFLAAAPDALAFVADDLIEAPGHLNTVRRERMAELIDRLLASEPCPTGLFVPADMQTVVAQAILLERGIEVGRGVEIISCNRTDILLAGLHPRPVSIDIHASQVGCRAAEQVLWRIEHPHEPAVHQSIEPEMEDSGLTKTPWRPT